MHELLTKLLQANLAMAAAVVLILVVRKGARAWFGARTAYGLWLLAPLAAAVSLAPPRSAEVIPAPAVASAPLVKAAEEAVQQTADVLWTWTAAPAAPAGLDPAIFAAGLWLAGLGLTAAWLAWRQWQFLRLMRRGDAGPAVIGFWRPRIVTPSDFEDRFDLRERAVVLAHEKIHLVRQDARINAFVALARCVCWFNPVVHLAAHLMRIDQELACDAAVVARHPKARAPYAQALLKAQLAIRPLPLGCYWPAGTRHPLTERVVMLKRSNPSTARRLAGAASIAVLAGATGYTAWAAAPAAAPAAAATVAYIEQTPAQVVATTAVPTKPQSSTAKAAGSVAPPTHVNLTNAGGEAAVITLSEADKAAIQAAIKAGDVDAIMEHGGSAKDVVEAMRSRLAADPNALLNPNAARPVALALWMKSTDEYAARGDAPTFFQEGGNTKMAFVDHDGYVRATTVVPGMNAPGRAPRGQGYDQGVPMSPTEIQSAMAAGNAEEALERSWQQSCALRLGEVRGQATCPPRPTAAPRGRYNDPR